MFYELHSQHLYLDYLRLHKLPDYEIQYVPYQVFTRSEIEKSKINTLNIRQSPIFRTGSLISAIVALCQRPVKIQEKFSHQSDPPPKNSPLIITLNKDGLQKQIQIDPSMLVQQKSFINSSFDVSLHEHTYTLMNTCIENEEVLWVSLIEKAFAWMYGSYEKVCHGLLEDQLFDLTGSPISTINVKEFTELDLGEFIYRTFNRGYPLVLSQNSYEQRIKNVQKGLISENQWSNPILEVRNTANDFIVVKIKEFKQLSFIGKYHKGQQKMSDKIKEELGINYDTDQTTNWYSVAEVRKHFNSLSYARVSTQAIYECPEWTLQNRTEPDQIQTLLGDITKFQDDFVATHITVEKYEKICVTVCQEDQRNFWDEQSQTSYRYAQIRLVVAQILKDQTIQYVSSSFGNLRNLSLEFDAQQGEYIVMAMCEWDTLQQRKLIRILFYNTQIVKPQKINIQQLDSLLVKPTTNIIFQFLKSVISSLFMLHNVNQYRLQNRLSQQQFIDRFLCHEDIERWSSEENNEFINEWDDNNYILYHQIKDLNWVTYDVPNILIKYGTFCKFYFIHINNLSLCGDKLCGKIQIPDFDYYLLNDEKQDLDKIEVFPAQNLTLIFRKYSETYKGQIELQNPHFSTQSMDASKSQRRISDYTLLSQTAKLQRKQTTLQFEPVFRIQLICFIIFTKNCLQREQSVRMWLMMCHLNLSILCLNHILKKQTISYKKQMQSNLCLKTFEKSFDQLRIEIIQNGKRSYRYYKEKKLEYPTVYTYANKQGFYLYYINMLQKIILRESVTMYHENLSFDLAINQIRIMIKSIQISSKLIFIQSFYQCNN